LEIQGRYCGGVYGARPGLFPVLGSCIMTMPFLMTCWLTGNFLGSKINYKIGPSTSCNFWLVPKLKTASKDHIVNSEGHMLAIMMSIPEEGFQHCLETVENAKSLSVLLCKEAFKGDRYSSYVGSSYNLYRNFMGT
jgi:hypothetical protein